ncbi:electron transport complex, RnfABCDGE type, G subunit [Desulfuromonas soudanensis]|uniref:Ion-translocating oxidoreductase complex subunit G n=1 Tax=Desulfuromonas soudanensis TaxID=1603606 RepID=A0A0M4CXR3_9BACT|nr:RnfABCDGE type electron transport complex subunit G [Desulfuromonas soudanensis]ALC15052.1 electron transport complex, RnfABCDGE type, G subunit [Desulfuromonas soudanensis]
MKELSRLALVLTIIAAAAGLILSLVEGVTRAPIAEVRRQETLKALRAVLPPIDNAPDADKVDLVIGKDRKGRDLLRTFYRGKLEGKLAGIAFKVVAPDGYSGNIEIMVGVDPEGRVVGIEILTHAETPGLGSKITAPVFKDQFRGKGLDDADWRVKKDGGSFDQITGATVSPRAVVQAVKSGLEFFREHRSQIVDSKGSAE